MPHKAECLNVQTSFKLHLANQDCFLKVDFKSEQPAKLKLNSQFLLFVLRTTLLLLKVHSHKLLLTHTTAALLLR